MKEKPSHNILNTSTYNDLRENQTAKIYKGKDLKEYETNINGKIQKDYTHRTILPIQNS